MSLYPNKKQIPQQMKISLALTTGFWNELYFYRANFIITEWSLFELYSFFYSFLIQVSIYNTLNPFKINTFSLIPYTLTLSAPFTCKKQTPQQMKISPASATGFWNELYFYRANFIFLESTLFDLYNNNRAVPICHSTVTLFARLRGLSTSHPFSTAM